PCPFGGRRRRCTPPDAVAQALRIRLKSQQAGRVGKHRARIRLGKALTADDVEKHLRVTACHVGIRLALFRGVAKVSPPLDHLLGQTRLIPSWRRPPEMMSAAPASSAM